MSNRTRSKLRTQGKAIKVTLENNPEYKKAFKKICEKLTDKILKFFKPMYLQGYFYIYEKDIIEIAKAESRDEILLLLFESLKHSGADEPVKEARRVLKIT